MDKIKEWATPKIPKLGQKLGLKEISTIFLGIVVLVVLWTKGKDVGNWISDKMGEKVKKPEVF